MSIDGVFDIDRLINPDSVYWPGYFYCWIDKNTAEMIADQVDDMASTGARSLCELPEPKNFRPETMQTWMDPDYLTDEYLEFYRTMTEEAAKRGMTLWVYDEGGWPSGGACGKVVKSNPELASQRLVCQQMQISAGEIPELPENILAAYTEVEGNWQRLPSLNTLATPDTVDRCVQIYSVQKYVERNPYTPAYPDLLNPKATSEFIRITHESYKRTVGDYFGNTVRFMFTDEPAVKNPPWTDGLNIAFQNQFGYDILDHLPAICDPESSDDVCARIDFFDFWSRRFVDAYFNVCKKWCRENDLLLAGHLGGEDFTEGSRAHGFGHITRVLRAMDVPGVDAIWRQVFPGQPNHHFPKYASSAAHQNGTPWAFAELFAVYGSGITPEQMKWITDYHYVRGINLTVVSAYPQSTREHFVAGERPVFGPTNPLWKHLSDYHRYTARLSYLLSLGKPGIETGLYFPVRDLWAGGADVKQVASANDIAAQRLLECLCDFDMVDDDLIETAQIVDGHLVLGAMSYKTICISQTKWMPDPVRAKLEEFTKAGGQVLWLFESNEVFGTQIDINTLENHITPTVELVSSCSDIRVCRRDMEKGSIVFLTNESMQNATCTLKVPDNTPVVLIDALTGSIATPANTINKGSQKYISITLQFSGSCIFGIGELFARSVSVEPIYDGFSMDISNGWNITRKISHEISEHQISIMNVEEAPCAIELGDWATVLDRSYSGTAEYRLVFECPADFAGKDCLLDLGEVRYGCEAMLNGEILGTAIWHPYVMPIIHGLKAGQNELRVQVTNTMANQYVNTTVFEGWTDEKLGPYHARALEFEKDTAYGGLYGPVQIVWR